MSNKITSLFAFALIQCTVDMKHGLFPSDVLNHNDPVTISRESDSQSDSLETDSLVHLNFPLIGDLFQSAVDKSTQKTSIQYRINPLDDSIFATIRIPYTEKQLNQKKTFRAIFTISINHPEKVPLLSQFATGHQELYYNLVCNRVESNR